MIGCRYIWSMTKNSHCYGNKPHATFVEIRTTMLEQAWEDKRDHDLDKESVHVFVGERQRKTSELKQLPSPSKTVRHNSSRKDPDKRYIKTKQLLDSRLNRHNARIRCVSFITIVMLASTG